MSALPASPRPIIGVLALPVEHADCITIYQTSQLQGGGATSCFHSLYAKWLEQAGARVAPIPYDLPEPAFNKLIGSLNGALITGGETDIKTLDSPYMRAAGRLYNHSLSLHAAGEAWPLWGTCMGFQVLSILGARDPSVLLSNAYSAEKLVMALELTPAAASSRLLCSNCLNPPAARTTLVTRNVTVNLHHDGVPPSAFAPGTMLADAFTVLSTNVDLNGKAFVSTMEATHGAPIWGAQWHAERPQFEWRSEDADFMDHGEDAVVAMAAVAQRLVREARLSKRSFDNEADETNALLYKYTPVGSADGGSYQAYFFGGSE